ncbi:hypothetical protein Taro_021459 [Colocasia esculenta]|uniref:Acyltransferase n=1 Tax=Colocasia esculenta TaxID=4460 RepID=A0A843URH9_COLES|nr:hypothetical protein [Colocasia esculenta]
MVRRSVEGSGHSYSMATAEEREAPPALASAPMPVVNRANGSSAFRSLVATMLWVGPIYFTVFLCFIALFLCRSTVSLWIIGLLVVLTFGPVNENSKYGTAIARFMGRYSPGYFHVSVHIEDTKAFDDKKAYVLAAEPHSIFPIGAVSLLDIAGLMPLKKTKVLASTAIFCTPFLRQVTTWMGLIPATKRNFTNYLKAGYSCIVIPGGVQEIIYMNRDYEIAYLKKRHGFVRVAIETGSPLVPVFCFGQNEAFNWWKPEGKLYIRISRAIRFAPLLFWGIFGSPVPYRSPVQVVVGKPIEVKQNPNPSTEEVAELHARFLSSLEALFAKYRVETGHADSELRIL